MLTRILGHLGPRGTMIALAVPGWLLLGVGTIGVSIVRDHIEVYSGSATDSTYSAKGYAALMGNTGDGVLTHYSDLTVRAL